MPTVADGAGEVLAGTLPARNGSAAPWLNGRDSADEPSNGHSRAFRPLGLLSDDRLAAQSTRGDSRAFAELYRRHHQRLYRYCLTLLRDPEDAADMLQTTMAKALSALERGERVKGVRPWLFRIAHNAAIDLVRSRRPQAALEALEEIESSALTAPSAASQAQSRAEVAETVADIRGLPRRQQSALVMRELAALSYAEIAGALDTSPLAARQLVHQARSALHDTRSGREMDCEVVRQTLGERDGKRPRDRRVRAHLAFRHGCASSGDSIQERSAALTAFAPPLAPVAASEILGRLLGGGSTSSAGLGGGGGLAAGVAKLVGAPGVAKLAGAAAVAATAAAAGGAVGVGENAVGSAAPRPASTEALLSSRPSGLQAMPAHPPRAVGHGESKEPDRSKSRSAERTRRRASAARRERRRGQAGKRERSGEARSPARSGVLSGDPRDALPRVERGALRVRRRIAVPRAGSAAGVPRPSLDVDRPARKIASVDLRGERDLRGGLLVAR
jgi:RNA polymerase sigma factor (sigma-70 family)